LKTFFSKKILTFLRKNMPFFKEIVARKNPIFIGAGIIIASASAVIGGFSIPKLPALINELATNSTASIAGDPILFSAVAIGGFCLGAALSTVGAISLYNKYHARSRIIPSKQEGEEKTNDIENQESKQVQTNLPILTINVEARAEQQNYTAANRSPESFLNATPHVYGSTTPSQLMTAKPQSLATVSENGSPQPGSRFASPTLTIPNANDSPKSTALKPNAQLITPANKDKIH